MSVAGIFRELFMPYMCGKNTRIVGIVDTTNGVQLYSHCITQSQTTSCLSTVPFTLVTTN